MTRIDAGDAALELKLTTRNNEHLTLAGFRGKQALVVFLYPKDARPSVPEKHHFRDAYEDFVDAGAAVIGVSGDSAAQHKEFASSHRLPFLLVSDFDDKAPDVRCTEVPGNSVGAGHLRDRHGSTCPPRISLAVCRRPS